MIFDYKGGRYPTYIKNGNACQFIAPAALHFCQGKGLDVGAGEWPLPGATPVDLKKGGDAMKLPEGQHDYVFSSHCLEHLADPIAAIEHWRTRVRPGGVIFLYLPHPDMRYWLPQFNRKHRHAWRPKEIELLLNDMGFENVLVSERDMYWSFAAVGFVKGVAPDAPFQSLIESVNHEISSDPQFAMIMKKFGEDSFRRSSGVEPEFKAIIEKHGFGGKRCIEIGTANGITALVLARTFHEVVSLDIRPHTMKRTVAEYLGVKNIRFVDIKDNAEKASLIGGLEFDAAYVDGDHANDTVTDFALVERCGRVLFHEYWDQQPPVWNLVNTLRRRGSVEVVGKFALWTRNG